MGINIKNPETERLIKALAELTGESQTAAVAGAVKDKIQRLAQERNRDGLVRKWLAIGKETAPLLTDSHAETEALYDYLHELYGLPR